MSAFIVPLECGMLFHLKSKTRNGGAVEIRPCKGSTRDSGGGVECPKGRLLKCGKVKVFTWVASCDRSCEELNADPDGGFYDFAEQTCRIILNYQHGNDKISKWSWGHVNYMGGDILASDLQRGQWYPYSQFSSAAPWKPATPLELEPTHTTHCSFWYELKYSSNADNNAEMLSYDKWKIRCSSGERQAVDPINHQSLEWRLI